MINNIDDKTINSIKKADVQGRRTMASVASSNMRKQDHALVL